MDPRQILDQLGLRGAAYAAPLSGADGVGFNAADLVTPASVMKIQVALAVESAIAQGELDGSAQRTLLPARRTPGPTGISLMSDPVSMSARDLVVAMLTISDNAATDELIGAVGLREINRRTRSLGMPRTAVTANLRDMLDGLAVEICFPDYAALVAHEPAVDGPPSADDIRSRLPLTAALDPARGTRTTAAETVTLLQAVWTDRAGPAPACASVRRNMRRQLTRTRIASGFPSQVTVAAKSGALLGVVRNEAGVVTFPDGDAYAIAVFTRNERRTAPDPAAVDVAIGRIAEGLISRLRD